MGTYQISENLLNRLVAEMWAEVDAAIDQVHRQVVERGTGEHELVSLPIGGYPGAVAAALNSLGIKVLLPDFNHEWANFAAYTSSLSVEQWVERLGLEGEVQSAVDALIGQATNGFAKMSFANRLLVRAAVKARIEAEHCSFAAEVVESELHVWDKNPDVAADRVADLAEAFLAKAKVQARQMGLKLPDRLSVVVYGIAAPDIYPPYLAGRLADALTERGISARVDIPFVEIDLSTVPEWGTRLETNPELREQVVAILTEAFAKQARFIRQLFADAHQRWEQLEPAEQADQAEPTLEQSWGEGPFQIWGESLPASGSVMAQVKASMAAAGFSWLENKEQVGTRMGRFVTTAITYEMVEDNAFDFATFFKGVFKS